MFDLSMEVMRVVEGAAIASARTMGKGDADGADHAAVESMRSILDDVAIDGTIVIGEGERDKAPMLYIGEKVGSAVGKDEAVCVDIAVERHLRDGFQHVSFFELLSDAAFAELTARGVPSREALQISAAERDADPLTCDGEAFASPGTLENWVDLD